MRLWILATGRPRDVVSLLVRACATAGCAACARLFQIESPRPVADANAQVPTRVSAVETRPAGGPTYHYADPQWGSLLRGHE